MRPNAFWTSASAFPKNENYSLNFSLQWILWTSKTALGVIHRHTKDLMLHDIIKVGLLTWLIYAVRRRTAHPSRCSTDCSVGPLSIPGCPGAPGLLTAPQLLQERQSPPAAPPRDGCGPVNWTVNRPGCKHVDTFMCMHKCLHTCT